MDNIYKSSPVEVIDITKHTHSEWSFLLKIALREEPGKFIMVSIPNSGEVPISISGFTDASIEITIRDAGKVTSEIFKIKPRDYLYVRGPYGNGFSLEQLVDKHLLIIVGGSGIAAVKPLIEYYQKPNQCRLKKLDILAGFKSPKHILFQREFQEWSSLAGQCNVLITVDTNEDEEERWLGGIGFVVKFIKDVKDLGRETQVIIVGPPMMMLNSVRELLGCQVKEERLLKY
mgnify:CR=1 FL=1